VRDPLMDFCQSGKMTRPRAEGGFAEKTKRDYREKINAIIYRPQTTAEREAGADREIEPFALLPARAIAPGAISNDEEGGFFEYLKRVRGFAMARGCIMVMSTAYKWGRKAKDWKLASNPCTQLGIPKLQATGKPWPLEALMAAIAFADHPDTASMK
jgi:hypothetical protein